MTFSTSAVQQLRMCRCCAGQVMQGLVFGLLGTLFVYALPFTGWPLGPALTMLFASSGVTKPAPSPYFLKLACAGGPAGVTRPTGHDAQGIREAVSQDVVLELACKYIVPAAGFQAFCLAHQWRATGAVHDRTVRRAEEQGECQNGAVRQH